MLIRFGILLFFTFCTLEASPTVLEKLNDEQVGKLPAEGDVVILNFWATWSAPCIEEIPVFVKLQKRFSNVRVIGVSMDEPEREAKIRTFLREHPVNYRVALWTGDNFEKMVSSIDPEWNGPIPATFIYKNGKRVYSKVGQITEAELLKQLQ